MDRNKLAFNYRLVYVNGEYRVEYLPRPAWYARLWRWVLRKEPPHA